MARTVARRGFLTMVALQIVTIGILMIVTKIRKVIRGRSATPFKVTAPRRIVVFGRGLDTVWAANFRVTGPVNDPSIDGTATLARRSRRSSRPPGSRASPP